MRKKKEKRPISLLRLVITGVASSLVVLGGLFLLFAAYETQTWLFWTAEERLDQDTLFGVGRNAVTLAAALGVGVTLFFSYRKQQTAEKAQELADKAQNMALESQRIATETLQLSLDKHALERVTELRNRYARSAEQLASDKDAVQLAGLHSLASLADDWIGIGNPDEQQVCISLICSFASGSDNGMQLGAELPREAATRLITSRLKREDVVGEKWWGASEIVLNSSSLREGMTDALLSGGTFTAIDSLWRHGIDGLNLQKGKLYIRGDISARTFPSGICGVFNGGQAVLQLTVGDKVKDLYITSSFFNGTDLNLYLEPDFEATVRFARCTFSTGTLAIWPRQHNVNIYFDDCIFESQSVVKVYTSEARKPAVKLRFRACTFTGEASPMRDNPSDSVFAIPEWILRSRHPSSGGDPVPPTSASAPVLQRQSTDRTTSDPT